MPFEFDTDGRLLVRVGGTAVFGVDSGTPIQISGTPTVRLTDPLFEATALLNISPQNAAATTGASINAPVRQNKTFVSRFFGQSAAAESSAVIQIWAGLTASASQEIMFSWNAVNAAAGGSDTAHITSVSNAWPVVRARIASISASGNTARSAEVRLYSVF